MRASLVIVLSLVTSIAAFSVLEVFVRPHLPVPEVAVPQLAGLSTAQARGLLEPRGLRLVLDAEVGCEKTAPGSVCDQKPLPDSRLLRGDEVHARIAGAGTTAKIPRTAGMTLDAARELLKQAHLRAGGNQPTANELTVGLVIGTTPAVDTEVKLDSTVDLLVSTGPATKPVPSVIGKRTSSAKETLEKAGFVLGAIKHGNDEDRDPGQVISQTPKAGEPAAIGSKVDLVINSD